MAFVMVLAMSVGAFAMDAGTYTPKLEGPAEMPHELNILAGDATVTVEGTQNKIDIPLQPMEVEDSEGNVVYGYVEGARSMTDGYTAQVENSHLIIYCSSDVTVTSFEDVILFNINREDEVTHNMPATLTLSAK